MADRHTRIFGSQIKDLTVTSDELAADSVIAGKIADGAVDVAAAIADGIVSEVKLDVNTAAGVGVDGYVLYWNNGVGKLDYKSVTSQDLSTVVLESDVIANEVPTGVINGANTDYTLANTPESGTVVVLLNGIQQQPGSGNDYILSGTTISFATAPETGMDVMANYLKVS